MPRTARAVESGLVYHVLNRGNGRQRIFHKPQDYSAFIALLVDGLRQADVQLLAYCLMPNHWHLALRPRTQTALSQYLSWVTNTHVKRYRAHYRRTSGHLYQGRFKSFVVQDDGHLLVVLRYIEANALRGRLVGRAQDWRWSSLGCDAKTRAALVSEWPIDRPRNWTALVNEAIDPAQLLRVRQSLLRDRPFGGEAWARKMAARLGLSHTLHPRGRPVKHK
jgi:REP-associated tyrosine transposase